MAWRVVDVVAVVVVVVMIVVIHVPYSGLCRKMAWRVVDVVVVVVVVVVMVVIYVLCAGQCRRVVRKVLDVVMVLLHLGSMAVWFYRVYVVMDDVTLAVLTPASMLLTSVSWWDNYVSGKKVGRNNGVVNTRFKSLWASLHSWSQELLVM